MELCIISTLGQTIYTGPTFFKVETLYEIIAP
jgi:hypothetical protein